jgi:ribonucleoside-diphosphate reductase alpha chain
VPLKDVVNKFAHVRFEPSGFTGNQEIPIAKSIVDYIFRWMGSRFLPSEEKGTLGLIDRSQVVDEAPVALSGAAALKPRADEGITAQSEAIAVPPATSPKADSPASAPAESPAAPAPAEDAPKATAVSAAPAPKEELTVIASGGSAHAPATGNGNGKGNGLSAIAASLGGSLGGGTRVAFAAQADAPSCAECGSIMVRNGSCYKCLNCGSTSGCS